MSTACWRSILPGVYLFEDSCNVYAVRGPGGMLIVDAGTGAWLDHLDELPAAPAALACTHYLRDHSAGAAAAGERGIPVWAPGGEYAIFTDPHEHFRRRETYIIYDNLWELFAPIGPTRVTGVLRDYLATDLAGLEVEVIPQPGATITQVGLGITLPKTGQRVVLCGETIHSPGKIARAAPLQYNYNDFKGGAAVYWSARMLRRRKPDAVLPSLGQPILNDVDGALAQLQASLRDYCRYRPDMLARFDALDRPETLIRITDHVYQSGDTNANCWLLLGESGKVMAIDYGYAGGSDWVGRAEPRTRRPLLHTVDALRRELGRDRIDVVLVSHFHDDHVCGIGLLQRLYGTRVWAADNFADLLIHPEAHCFPCNWPMPTKVDRRLPLDQPVRWEQFTFHLAPMSGHTRFASLIGFEVDGKRFAHTGDQHFFQNGVESFAHNPPRMSYVFRNGAMLDGYEQSGRWLLDHRPDVVLQGHQPAMWTDDAFFETVEKWSGEYRDIHERLMPLGKDEAHFNVDSWGGWIWPYRTVLPAPGPTAVTVTVRNPLPESAELRVRLVGQRGWVGSEATLRAAGRAQASVSMTITPDAACRLTPFAAELTVNGRRYGQVAEALMTVGAALHQ